MATPGQASDAPPRLPPQLPLAAAVTVPGSVLGLMTYLQLGAPELSTPLLALLYGLAIVGAAFLLSWAAEAVQVDISAGLALALLALLAVLPEYAVDFVFTVQCGGAYASSGGTPEICSLALANMTGANRVLVGVGWPLVIIVATVAVWSSRARDGVDAAPSETASPGRIELPRQMATEITFLGLATLWSLTLALKDSLTLVDSLVFVAIFVTYAWRLARMPAHDPDLMGVSLYVGTRATKGRRAWVAAMFAFAALVIMLSAEHFAESLVATGKEIGVSEFLLVQWVAPLASEAPELIVACLYAWRLKAGDSLGALLSAKVNQWTLLVGSLPIVFALAAGTLDGLPLDTEQRFELLITAAQSLFAVAILLDRSLSYRGAGLLLALFSTQFLVSVLGTDAANRWTIIALSVVYGVLAVVRIARRVPSVRGLVRDGLITRYEDPADA